MLNRESPWQYVFWLLNCKTHRTKETNQLWLYSNNLKRQPLIGNVLVAILTGLSIDLVDLLYDLHNTLVIIYSLFAFFMTLVREIVKDMEDMKGDYTFGCRTLPIIWGIRKTKWVLYFILTIFLAVVFILNLTYHLMPSYFLILFLFLPIGLLVIRLARADTKKEFYQLSQACKIIMLLGITSMVFI